VYPADPSSGRWDVAFALLGIGVASAWFVLGTEGDPSRGANLALFVGLHLATSMALFTYARSRTGRVIAFGVGSVFLLLGAASQMSASLEHLGWVAATAAGAWALVIVLGPAPIRFAPAAAGLLAAAALTSPVGAAFVVAAAVPLLPDGRRRSLWVIVPGLAASVAWLVRSGPSDPSSLPGLGLVLKDAIEGIGQAVGSVAGVGPQLGLTLALLLFLATGATLVQSPSIRLGLVAGSVGLFVEYLLLGVARGTTEGAAAGEGSSVYSAAVFILIALTSWLAHRPLDMPGQRLRLASIVAALVAVSVAGSR
jgi:hypothetical protein